MKRIASISMMLCFTAILFGQGQVVTDKSHIHKLITGSFDEIWSGLNAEKMEKYYTMDFLLLENGEIWNLDSIANYLDKARLKNPIPKRLNTIEIVEAKISGNMAWVAYKNHAVFTVDGKIVREAHWLESATAVLTEDGWKLDMLHSSPVEGE